MKNIITLILLLICSELFAQQNTPSKNKSQTKNKKQVAPTAVVGKTDNITLKQCVKCPKSIGMSDAIKEERQNNIVKQ